MPLVMSALRLISRTHLIPALGIVTFVVLYMAGQIAWRADFANSELYHDVLDRWGTPIEQPVPSVRAVEHGAVFSKLDAVPFSRQTVRVDAEMNYRKRGLVYFSGFDFRFDGSYGTRNDADHAIDIAFVFPLHADRARILLSELAFEVNGQPEPITLREGDDKLLWTGRLAAGEEVDFHISYRGRGLDQFRYLLDPALPVRGLDFTLRVSGGDDYDYPEGVAPATSVASDRDGWTMHWRYDSLESGVPVGAILPSEEGFDAIVGSMIVRAIVPFGLFFVGLVTLGLIHEHRFRVHETALLTTAWSFFFVLLPYLASFIHFYLAYPIALALTALLVVGYLTRLLGVEASWESAALLSATLLVPTLAVVIRGYTGLIYTAEIFALIAALMAATTHPTFRTFAEDLRTLGAPAGGHP